MIINCKFDFKNSLLKVLKFISLKGRINRTEIFYYTVLILLFELIAFLLFPTKSLGFIIISFFLLILYCIQCAKRYHDLNMWGINGFVWFIVPIANIFYFFQVYFKKGSTEFNKYGDPSNFKLKKNIQNINSRYSSELEVTNKFNVSEQEVSNSMNSKEQEVSNSINSLLQEATNLSQRLEQEVPNSINELEQEATNLKKRILQAMTDTINNSKQESTSDPESYQMTDADSQFTENLNKYNIISFRPINEELFQKYHRIEFKENFINNSLGYGIVNIILWQKKDGNICRKGDDICMLLTTRDNRRKITMVKSDKNGFIKIPEEVKSLTNDEPVREGIILFEIKEIFPQPNIKFDLFNNCKTLKWDSVGSNNFRDVRLNGFISTVLGFNKRFFLSINYLDSKDYLVVNYPKKDYEIRKNDTFHILLDNKELLSFYFNKNSYSVYDCFENNLGGIKENKLEIPLPYIKKLATTKIIDLKIKLQEGQEMTEMRPFGDQFYQNIEQLQEQFQIMFSEYLRIVTEFENYSPILDYSAIDNSQSDECYLYLMVDTINNYHKIGISSSPFYREKTLQSEKPTIELIASKKFPNRGIAKSIEKALHENYKNKHVRGEWFYLSQDDFLILKRHLNK